MINNEQLFQSVLTAILQGASSTDVQFCHQIDMTPYQGIKIENVDDKNAKLSFNASSWLMEKGHDLTEAELSVYDELVVEVMTPFLVATEFFKNATLRDWQAVFIRRELMKEEVYGAAVSGLYRAQSEAVQWALAYSVLDKKNYRGEWLFQRVVYQVLPHSTLYIRQQSSKETRQQFEWLIHVPDYSRKDVDSFIQLAAQLLLPFYHVAAVVAKEPMAIIGRPSHMKIGAMRIVDDAFNR